MEIIDQKILHDSVTWPLPPRYDDPGFIRPSGGSRNDTKRIIYTAPSKLVETTSYKQNGAMNTTKFSSPIKSHTFENGVGVIEFEDDLTGIYDYAMYRVNITSIIIPDSVKNYNPSAIVPLNPDCTINIPKDLSYSSESSMYSDIQLYFPAQRQTYDGIFYVDKTVVGLADGYLTKYNIKDGTINVFTVFGISAYSTPYVLEINIPDSVERIPAGYTLLQYNANGLILYEDHVGYYKNVLIKAATNLDSDVSYWQSQDTIQIKDGTSFIGYSAFSVYNQAFSNITSIEFPKSVKLICSYAFLNLSGITKVSFPSKIKFIEQNAFYGCTNLQEVNIPKSIAYIGSYAFYNCNNLKTIKMHSVVPPELGSLGFFGTRSPQLQSSQYIIPEGLKIYVPAASVNAYKTADVWSNYADCIEPLS